VFEDRSDECKLYNDVVAQLRCVVITTQHAAVFAL